MPRLDVEITDELMEKLQERANTYALKPSDITKLILAHELAKTKRPQWTDKLTELVSRLSDAVIAVSDIKIPK